MATGVSLINNDMLRYYQTQNLLAPPEAIELTKLYNEMSELLKKPVKYRDQAVQLNLFYDLLSQYGKHLQNLNLASTSDDIPTITPPVIPKPPSPKKQKTSSVIEPEKPAVSDDPPISSKTPTASTSSEPIINDDDDVFDITPTKISTPPASPITKYVEKQFASKKNSVPELVMRSLKENDSTFQLFEDVGKIIISGREVPTAYFLNVINKMRKPEFRLPAKPDTDDPLFYTVAHKISKVVQTTDMKKRSNILKSLKGLQNAISEQARGSRKQMQPAPTLSAYSSPITATTTAPPQKLTLGQGKQKKSKYAVVNWKRWQRHLQKL
jgi:DNA-binding transcriptional MerR regulator